MAIRHLKFSKFGILQWLLWTKGQMCCHHANLMKTGQTVAEIWQFIVFFSRWRLSAILDL